jgi:DNA-binding CsgD family transcriptional regulator
MQRIDVGASADRGAIKGEPRTLSSQSEVLFGAAMACAEPQPFGRLPRLMMAVCDAMDAAGGFVSRSPRSRADASGVLHAFMRAKPLSERRAASLLGRKPNMPGSVSLISAAAEGGPAMIANGFHRTSLIVYRVAEGDHFSEQDAQLVAAFWRVCEQRALADPPDREIATSGRSGGHPPRVMEVLGCLLDGMAEKQIAHRLGISRHTVHVYIKTLYRQHGVSSKSGLLIHFLGGGSSPVHAGTSIAPVRPRVSFRPTMEIKGSQIEPADQIVAPPLPVPSIDRALSNMFLSDVKAMGQNANAAL